MSYKITNYDENMIIHNLKEVHPVYGQCLCIKDFMHSSDTYDVTIDEILFDNLKLVAMQFEKVNLWLKEHGCYATINHCYRHVRTQERLLKEGLSGKRSLHLYGLATDISIYDIKRKSLKQKSIILCLAKDMFNELDFTLEVVVYSNFIHITYDHKISRKINPKREFIISKLFTK